MTIHDLDTRLIMNYVATRDGSPCLKCIVFPTCTKSVVSKTACEDYIVFINDLIKKMGEKDIEDKKRLRNE